MVKNTKINLEVAERILALGLLRQWKGNLEELAIVQDDLKHFPFTEEEKKALNIVEKEGSIQWKPDAPTKEFALSQVSVDFIVGKIKELSDKKMIAITDGPIVSLYKKLG